MRTKYYFFSYLLSLIFLSILPINRVNAVITDTYIIELRLDYVLHTLLYLPFFLLYRPRLQTRISYNPNNHSHTIFFTVPTFIFGLFVCTSTEAIQYFLPYRAFNINDLLANTIGMSLSLIVYLPFVQSKLVRLVADSKNSEV